MHSITLPETDSRAAQYEALQPQIAALMQEEEDPIANMANLSAAIKGAFGWHWVGFYLAKGEELVLGPFQGPVACTRIPKGKGVCGKAWESQKTQIVADVEDFPGHIACSPHSKSEIVVPFRLKNGQSAVLDIDSSELGSFTEEDAQALEKLLALLA